MSGEIKVRKGLAILAPFGSIMRDAKEILSRPLPLLGGVVGTCLLCGGIGAFFLASSSLAQAEDEDLLDIEFMPGEIARLGDAPEPDKIPDKIIVDDQRAADAEPEKVLTKEDKPPEKPPEKPKPKDPPKKKEKKKRIAPRSKKKTGKLSDKDVQGNNKFGDLATLDRLPGNPFGSADGWGKLNRAGDPWATSVMGALNRMKVPAWAAQASGRSPVRFRIKICKDGRISQVMKKGSSGDSRLDDAVIQELLRLKIPRPPPHVAKAMSGSCTTMKYNFAWKAGRVK